MRDPPYVESEKGRRGLNRSWVWNNRERGVAELEREEGTVRGSAVDGALYDAKGGKEERDGKVSEDEESGGEGIPEGGGGAWKGFEGLFLGLVPSQSSFMDCM